MLQVVFSTLRIGRIPSTGIPPTCYLFADQDILKSKQFSLLLSSVCKETQDPRFMHAKDIFEAEGIFFAESTISGKTCHIGYRKEFRLSWFATQLNTFIIVGEADGTITQEMIEDFSSGCFQFALNNSKGWPRGIQAAVSSIAILRGERMEPEAISVCEKLRKKHWSAFEIPVLYDTKKQEAIRFVKTPSWGMIFFPYFRKTIDQITAKLS